MCEDLNVAEPLGVCASPYCQVGGRRQSTAVSYLEPARGRPNLAIAADTTVARLVLDGARVTGVELIGPDGTLETVLADRVVLSAGVYHSPQLLLLSGIGSPAALDPVGSRCATAWTAWGRGSRTTRWSTSRSRAPRSCTRTSSSPRCA